MESRKTKHTYQITHQQQHNSEVLQSTNKDHLDDWYRRSGVQPHLNLEPPPLREIIVR